MLFLCGVLNFASNQNVVVDFCVEIVQGGFLIKVFTGVWPVFQNFNLRKSRKKQLNAILFMIKLSTN